MTRISIDPDSELVQECFAVVYAPRRQRQRFPENCVLVMASEQEAVESAQPEEKRYAARVIGPSRSSEGLRLYYLVHWIE